MIRRYLRGALRRIQRWLDEVDERPASQPVPFDNTYEWINDNFHRLMKDSLCARRPHYAWGVLQGAALGRVLEQKRVSVIEFGVAAGSGLLALERIAELATELTSIEIEVYGFDSGVGLPEPQDYRDTPNVWLGAGQFPMDAEQLQRRLRRASLKLGPVDATVPAFSQSDAAPVAFVSFDLDLYSSTRHALGLFDADHARLLPRIVCYFDDIIGTTHSDFTGGRLALSEFNASHALRKVSPVYGLKYFVPSRYKHEGWPEVTYFAHIFDHPLYNRPDQIRKHMFLNIESKATGFQLAKESGPQLRHAALKGLRPEKKPGVIRGSPLSERGPF